MDDLISRAAAIKLLRGEAIAKYPYSFCLGLFAAADEVNKLPAVDAVEVSEIKAYLQSKLDEWNALGDRKFEPANMWGYNFIMACFDDLSSYGERRGDNG